MRQRATAFLRTMLCLAAASTISFAQTPGSHPMTDIYGHMGIGTTAPDKSAILDLNSTTAGFLMPRLTNAQRNAIVNPATGLMIFNTDTKTIEFNIGTTFAPIWDPVVTISSGSGLYWQLLGNAGTNPAVNFIGTTDAQPLVVRTSNTERLRVATTGEVGIGTAAPTAGRLLEVAGTAGAANVRLGSTSGTADPSPWTPTANDGFVTADANGDLLKRSASAAVGAVAWLKTGNGGAFTDGTDNLLGTTSNAPLNVIVNGARAMRFEPNATSPNVIGGFNGNAVTAGAVGAVIAGGGASGGSNRVTDDYGFVGGGYNNRAGDDAGTVNSHQYATVGGGWTNTASGVSSTVGGGESNRASAYFTTVAGGENNRASGNSSAVGGGQSNRASGIYAIVAGGYRNTASEYVATVGGGWANTASGVSSTVSGGEDNVASGDASTMGGGRDNLASADSSTVGGGRANTASGISSTVGGGYLNRASGYISMVSGGSANTASGDYSAIPGGRGLTLDANADRSFGFHANTAAGNRNMTISASDVAVFGNTDLWLANNDNAPSELRFFEAYNAAGAFPNTANYTAFKAQTQAANITYTLPSGIPAAAGTNQLGAGMMLTDNSGNLSWKQARTTSAALTFALTATGATDDQTITVTGATVGDIVSLGVPNGAVPAGFALFSAWVSAVNTVTVRFYNNTGANQTPTGTFSVMVVKP